jgi:hypothetical protein
LKVCLDADHPVPIGLIRDRKRLYDNHQVVALSYVVMDESQVSVQVYDPNQPGGEATIELRFRPDMLDGQESSGSESLRGFFVERYSTRLPDWIEVEPQEE